LLRSAIDSASSRGTEIVFAIRILDGEGTNLTVGTDMRGSRARSSLFVADPYLTLEHKRCHYP
jgi:hypothetical protein